MMEQNKNPNHPGKGRVIRVDPIRRSEDIQAIKLLLSGTPRDLLLFTMGINNGLRAGDLLMVKVKDVKSLKPGEFITIKENKTGKQNILMVNKFVHKALRNYLEKVRTGRRRLSFCEPQDEGAPQHSSRQRLDKEMDQGDQSGPWKLWSAYLKEDVRVHAAHQVRGGLRGPGQAVQSFQPHDHHEVSWPYER